MVVINEAGPDAPFAREPRTDQRDAGASPVRVLLVEDEPADAGVVDRMLASSTNPRFCLTVAKTFAEALAHSRGGGCDVILLDLSLPDSRGADSVQELALTAPRTPIVVLTGLDHEYMAVRALRHGAQDYLVKGKHDALLVCRAIRYAIERKGFEGVLAERAHFDSLTGLVNRALFQDRLSHALARASRARKRVALMFIDLDGFKSINDTLGHEAGDQVLKAVAKLLRGSARRGETVARLGGDEFTVILEEAHDKSDITVAAKRVLRALAAPLAISSPDVRVTCSLGIALFPDSAADAESLLRNADAAMFRAKRSGGNNIQFFGEN